MKHGFESRWGHLWLGTSKPRAGYVGPQHVPALGHSRADKWIVRLFAAVHDAVATPQAFMLPRATAFT